MRLVGLRRRTIAALVVSLLGTGAVVAAEPAASEPIARDTPTFAKAGDGPKLLPWNGSPAPAPAIRSRPGKPNIGKFPEAGAWNVRLGRKGEPGSVAAGVAKQLGVTSADKLPVTVSSGIDSVAGQELGVRVFGRDVAKKVGASGFVFSIHAEAGSPMPVQLTIDYSGFIDAFGGDYAQRLRLRALPACATVDPLPEGCDPTGVPLSASNNPDAGKLVVDVADLSGLSRTNVAVFAVTSAVGGETGTFAASALSPAGAWQVSPGSGEFGYAYPIDVPEPAGGKAPTVEIRYSSGAVDALTNATNMQASSEVGLGWSTFANAFIERRYQPCIANGLQDLCWVSDNATISLGGLSGTLVPDSSFTNWYLQNHPGWRFQRVDGAAYTDTHGAKYWVVTAPDGTEYRFGAGHGPGVFTDSILGVEVFADAGEPCADLNKVGNLPGHCKQAWRWYLDRVVDPDGMVTVYDYTKETNFYSAANGAYPFNLSYDRAAYLSQILYGGENGNWDDREVAARVVFGTQYRCLYLDSRCDAAPPQSEVNWLFPDVPLDLVCSQAIGNCGVHAPSFFSGVHYTHVRTEVRKGSTWKPVNQTNLYKTFASPDNTWPQKLVLTDIGHAGIAFGGLAGYPATHLDYGYLQNRQDATDPNSKAAMRNLRLTRITNPLGGMTQVNYGQPNPCPSNYSLPDKDWDENPKDCFRQLIVDDSGPRTGIFNKWLVGQVREQPGNGSPEMWTGFIYEGTPAWAFDAMSFARYDDSWGFSNWRGYLTTVITKGTEAEVMSWGGSARTRVRVFRGLNGDKFLQLNGSGTGWVATGVRPESIYALDGRGPFPDDRHLVGRTLQEQQLGGASFTPVTSTLYEYEQRRVFENTQYADGLAVWVGLSKVTERDYSSPTDFKERRSKTTYTNPATLGAPPQPATTTEEGRLDVTGDERCTITSYASNATRWMWAYPAKTEVTKGTTCSAQAERLTVNEIYYDGDNSATPGTGPTKGNPTRQRSKIESNRWSQTLTEYDSMGRVVKVTDPNGKATTTTYENNIPSEDPETTNAPRVAIPVKVTTTNPLGHKAVTYLNPEFGSPRVIFDVNGNPTTYTYDSFGNRTSVRLPTEHGPGDEPSWQFAYDIANKAVRTRQLTSIAAQGSAVTFADSWVIYDGFWRERQTQTQSPASGRVLVTETAYDERGQVRDEFAAQDFSGNPGAYLTVTGWANRTRHIYDALGRETANQWWRGNSPSSATTIGYGVDTTTTTGPTGRVATAKIDGLGRTVEVAEKDGATWAKSLLAYDLADRLMGITDPEGNKTSFGYYMTGWRLSHNDPDRGGAIFSYDDAGNNTSVLTSGDNRVTTKYDALNRPIERRADSATGPLLASWTYDTAARGVGMVHKASAHTPSGVWVSEVTGYDGRGRVGGVRLTVPPGVPGLSGSYATSQTYDRADQVRSVTYPQIGGLPQETLTTSYTSQGLPATMSGLDSYVSGASYDGRGRKTGIALGPMVPGSWMVKFFGYNQDQQLSRSETQIATGGAYQQVAKHTIGYALDGNVSDRTTKLGTDEWRECYGYDARGRLKDAYTLAMTGTCGPSAPRGTGPQPYNHSYAYSPAGNLLQRTENGSTTTYTYPADPQPSNPDVGAVRPHAPRQVGSDTYQWDVRGNLSSRTVGGTNETFTWDKQGQLTSVAKAGATTSFVYEVSGQRVLRKTGTDTTLYFAGHEVTANAAGTSITAVRSYVFGGQLVATRRTGAPADYVVTDPAGSLEMAIPSGAGAPSATRRYNPYGRVRSETGDPASDRGFIGQVEDASTKLSYLNARYYDARIGIFVSADPILSPGQPKSLNPYSYAGGNPATFSDPSGLHPGPSWGQYFKLLWDNVRLRMENAALRLTIGALRGIIAGLQRIIQMQKSTINSLMSRIRTLEKIIQKKDAIIRGLEHKIRALVNLNKRQQKAISVLEAKLHRAREIIDKQAHVIKAQQGVIAVLRAKLIWCTLNCGRFGGMGGGDWDDDGVGGGGGGSWGGDDDSSGDDSDGMSMSPRQIDWSQFWWRVLEFLLGVTRPQPPDTVPPDRDPTGQYPPSTTTPSTTAPTTTTPTTTPTTDPPTTDPPDDDDDDDDGEAG